MTVTSSQWWREKRRHHTASYTRATELAMGITPFILLHLWGCIKRSYKYLKTLLLTLMTAVERRTDPCDANVWHTLIWETHQLSSFITQNKAEIRTSVVETKSGADTLPRPDVSSEGTSTERSQKAPGLFMCPGWGPSLFLSVPLTAHNSLNSPSLQQVVLASKHHVTHCKLYSYGLRPFSSDLICCIVGK